MPELIITIIQSELHWENIDKNLEMFTQKITSISETTDLIILPEMFSTGFTMNAKACAEEMNGKTIEWLKQKAAEKKCVITGSIIIHEKENFYNRLIWMKPEGTFELYDKRHLFRLADEHQTYANGTKKINVEINGWKICPLICYDLRFPVWSRRTNQENYDLLIYVANWPERRIFAWQQLLIARAIENQCYVAGVNRVGNDGNANYYSGYSAIIDFKGELLTKSGAEMDFIETIAIKKQSILDFRANFPFGADADDFRINS